MSTGRIMGIVVLVIGLIVFVPTAISYHSLSDFDQSLSSNKNIMTLTFIIGLILDVTGIFLIAKFRKKKSSSNGDSH